MKSEAGKIEQDSWDSLCPFSEVPGECHQYRRKFHSLDRNEGIFNMEGGNVRMLRMRMGITNKILASGCQQTLLLIS